jgi:hypothetical protein
MLWVQKNYWPRKSEKQEFYYKFDWMTESVPEYTVSLFLFLDQAHQQQQMLLRQSATEDMIRQPCAYMCEFFPSCPHREVAPPFTIRYALLV